MIIRNERDLHVAIRRELEKIFDRGYNQSVAKAANVNVSTKIIVGYMEDFMLTKEGMAMSTLLRYELGRDSQKEGEQ